MTLAPLKARLIEWQQHLYQFKPGIFLRIYLGLLVVCFLVGLFAYILIQNINIHRMHLYREKLANGPVHVIVEGYNRQKTHTEQETWLNDAGLLLGFPVNIVNRGLIDFTHSERKRLKEDKPIVRYNQQYSFADIYIATREPQQLLHARIIDQLGEQQIKAMSVFILDDLMHHQESPAERLQQLQKYFTFPIRIVDGESLHLDIDQHVRLRRNEIVIAFRDSDRVASATLEVYSPMGNGRVLAFGPIPMFNRMPLEMFVIVAILSLLLISIGVYTLIFPLERKLYQVRLAMRQVITGDFSTRVPVDGHDEVGQLADMFNRMTEHTKRLIDAQRELTRAVSHELRTPVARIRFGIEMLVDTDDLDNRIEQQNRIDDDIHSLNELIDEILTYAKLEQGRPSLHMEEIDLHLLVEQVTTETRAINKNQDIQIESQIEGRGNTVIAERRYLHRVAQNFAVNALKYANGQVLIKAGINGNRAFISVEDDGHGVPEKDRKKIFEPFARLDDSRTRASGGYGLGLSIVARIAFWFDGKVEVAESENLGGAKFTMTWPARPGK